MSLAELAWVYFALVMHVALGAAAAHAVHVRRRDREVDARVLEVLRGREREVEEYGQQCLRAGRELGANEALRAIESVKAGLRLN